MNKKILIYIAIAFISLCPILKVNAAYSQNGSTNTILQAKISVLYNEVYEWIYNTSDSYLMNITNQYNTSTIRIDYNGINTNKSSIGINIYLNNDNKLINRFRSGYTSGIYYQNNVTKYISIIFYKDENTNKYYSDENLTNEIQNINNLTFYNEINDTSSISYKSIFGIGITNVNKNYNPYTIYYNNAEIVYNGSYDRNLELYDIGNQLIGTYGVGDIIPGWKDIYHGIPDYLQGYKKQFLLASWKYYSISGINNGNIYITKENFDTFQPKIGYLDTDITTSLNIFYNNDYEIMEDQEYVKQEFNLSNSTEFETIIFNKNTTTNEDTEDQYFIWIPEEAYFSFVTWQEEDGNKNYEIEWKDENGDIQNTNIITNNTNINFNDMINEFFKNSNNTIFYNFNLVWENIKNHSIYNYLLILIWGSFIIYFIKVIKK